MRYTKINKAVARKLYTEEKPFIIVPCNILIQYGLEINKYSFEQMAGVSFDSMVNAFIYYNCSNETGRYPHFYIREE